MLPTNSTAVVTGAGGGLGLAIATVLAAHGAIVCALDIKPEMAENAARTIRAGGGKAFAVPVDVSDHHAVAEAFRVVDAHVGKVDILVNCAGVREVKTIYDLTPEEWLKVVAINLNGPYYCSREAALRMRESGGGSIINIASVAGLMGITHRPAYTATKHALVGLTKNLAKDLAAANIRVNAVGPGTLRTPLTESYYHDENFINGLKETVPMGTKGSSADVANAVLFLCSPLAGFITGVLLPVDGGWGCEKSYAVGSGPGPYTAAAASSLTR